MLFGTIIKVALKSLWAHKLRSFLAMLGIIIGVMAVVSMLALGAGAQQSVMKRISAMGTDLLVVRPGESGMHGVSSGTRQTLTVEDAVAIVQEVADVRGVAPLVRGSAQVKRLNRNSRVGVQGTSATYLSIRNFEIEKGRMFTEQESEGMARIAVLGPTTATNLFGDDPPLGQIIKVNRINFRVIGVLKSKGDQGWFNPDDQVIIPYTTAMKQLLGLDYLQEIDIEVAKDASQATVQEAAAKLLRKRHRLADEAANDFEIRSQAEMLETASTITGYFTILLAGIASISLLVGGIGIMNIMLVTVTERTREIGVRKAIGAKESDILKQFLIEAVVMSALGGLIGVMFGIGGAKLIQSLASFDTVVTPTSVALALSFSAAVGIFFGYYPASRAAKLDPIESLRYE